MDVWLGCNSTSDVPPAHLRYWPGSPTNASYFFDYDVFHFWDTMQKNMPGSSCSAFVKTLAQISEKKGRVQVSILCIHCTIIMDLINSAAILYGFTCFFLTTTFSTSLQAGIITPSTFSKAFQEWRYCQFELYQASGMNFMTCPCCFNAQLACHTDGNGKTYRWKKVNA